MLLTLVSAFALSQAYRTVAAILGPPLAAEFALTPQALGLFAAAFHFSFGALQPVMGLGIDLLGLRRTVLMAFPLAIVGALVSAAAPGFAVLLLGQVLIGVGCAPAFLVCTVFIARQFAVERFAAVSGAALGIGSVGLLLTGTPLAWIVETWSWRAGFVALAIASALSWLAIFTLVREPPLPAGAARETTLGGALRGYGELLRLPHTAGIVLLALFTYSAFMALRGLWLGPLLLERHGFTLVQAGHVALAVSVVGMAGPPLLGRLDPGPTKRRAWIIAGNGVVALVFAVMALAPHALSDVALSVAIGLLSGYIVLQYADVRNAYPPAMTGRAMAVFTMAMFLGVALVQWLTGAIASLAQSLGWDVYACVLLSIAFLLAASALAFRLLPAPPGTQAQSAP